MNRRLAKQVSYGIFYGILWLACGYAFFTVILKPAPTCSDTIKNQDETDVDCGGMYCVSCEIKHLLTIQVLPVRLLSAADAQHSTAVVELRNPNATYGAASFSYLLNIFTTSTMPAYTEQITVPMYPSEVKYRVTATVPVGLTQITRAEAVATGPVTDWRNALDFSKPKLPVREIKTSAEVDRITVSGFVKNDNPFFMRHITVNVFFDGPNGSVLTASKTIVNDVLSAQERGFQLFIPLPSTLAGQTLPTPRIIVDGERQL